jgi:hypothetical protein
VPTPDEIERRIAALSRLVAAGLPTDEPAPDAVSAAGLIIEAKGTGHVGRERSDAERARDADPLHRQREAQRKRMFRLARRLAKRREVGRDAEAHLRATYVVAVLLPDGRICHVRGRTRAEARTAARESLGIESARLPKGTRFFIVGGPG